MKITDIRVKVVNGDEKYKARVSVTIEDSIVIHNIKVIDGQKGLFISMPNYKNQEGKHKDIVHPIKKEVREELNNEILKAYEKALKEPAQDE